MDNIDRNDEPNPRRIVSIGDVKPRSSKGKRMKTTLAIVGMVAVVAVLVIVFGLAGSTDIPKVADYTMATVELADFVKTTEASGTVVVPAELDVPSPETGYAETLIVSEGDSVKEGQLLATLSVPDLVEKYDDLVAQMDSAELAMSELVNDYEYQLQTLTTSISRLETQISDANETLATKKALLALSSSRQSEYDAAEDALTALEEKRDDAVAQKQNTERKRVIALSKQQATINQLQVSMDRTAASIEEARIKAPMSGEILSIASKLSVPGSLIAANETLLTIADMAGTYIDFEVDEQYVTILAVGDKLVATIGTQTITATITKIGKVASLSSDGLTATVSVRTKPESGTSLTPGASAVATITLGTTAGSLVLPRGAYLTTGGQKYVYVVNGNTAKKTAVEFGDMQGNKVVITKGLEAGDRIITTGYTSFIDSDTVELK